MMSDYEAIKEAPFANLDWFTHWGARGWQKFVEIALGLYFGKDLSGKKILEIGPGQGRMSCLFAILGGEVTGLDLKEEDLKLARENAEGFKIADKIHFMLYDGDLGILGNQTFDIIFTKSTLICIPELQAFLMRLSDHLKDDGKFAFIENGKGNLLINLGRLLKRRSLAFFKRNYFFTQNEIDLIKSIFEVELLMRSKIPPVYLICGKKK